MVSMREAHDPEELVSRDMDFHAQIAEATGNTSLCSILDAISSRAVRARVWRASTLGMKTMTLSAHQQILEALTDRDPSLAHAAATVHVSESERWLNEHLSVKRHQGKSPSHSNTHIHTDTHIHMNQTLVEQGAVT
jgi:GntR family transcriptional repressor for pyruvate dehydrogenase complex